MNEKVYVIGRIVGGVKKQLIIETLWGEKMIVDRFSFVRNLIGEHKIFEIPKKEVYDE